MYLLICAYISFMSHMYNYIYIYIYMYMYALAFQMQLCRRPKQNETPPLSGASLLSLEAASRIFSTKRRLPIVT